jgi:type II secretory pathway pseudopilin PulG
MVVISVLAAVTIVALPGLLHSRLAANETAAVNTLKYLSQAEENFRAEVAQNEDNDDSGEYGTFGMLAGAVPLSRGRPADPAYLDKRFRTPDPDTVIESRGYRFRIFLPQEAVRVRDQDLQKTDLRELCWCAYAWPIEPGKSGNHVFFICQDPAIVYSAAVDRVSLPVTSPAPAYRQVPFLGQLNILEWSPVR